MIEGFHETPDLIDNEKQELFRDVTRNLNNLEEDVVSEGKKVDENEKIFDNDGGDGRRLSRREAKKYHDDFELHYITQNGKKGVLRAKRKPDKSTCALYNEKNEKLSGDYDTLKPLQNEKGEWNRLFAGRKMGKGYCLVNEWGNECSKYYEHISDIVYKPVGGDFSTLSEGNPINTIGLELSYVGEKSDGTKVVVDRNGNETILSKK